LIVEILEDKPERQARAYLALDQALRIYPGHWTRFTDGAVEPGSVTVALTGTSAPRHLMSTQAERYVFCDGSFGDIGAWAAPTTLVPMVSEHWSCRFGWDGVGVIPVAERVMLRQLVAAAHADGRRIRLYGIPERTARVRQAFWQELLAAGVDVISTAKPRRLAAFFRNHQNLETVEFACGALAAPLYLELDSGSSRLDSSLRVISG
jgi:hypothetical protein